MFYRALALVVITCLLACAAYADYQNPANQAKVIDLPTAERVNPVRTAPEYSFSRPPVLLMTSYVDYMIGSYNGLPLGLIPDVAGGGYFMTYHGSTNPTSLRRVYYAYIGETGNLLSNYTVSLNNNREGYPTMAVDPVSGKPMYAWHENADADPQLEVMFVSDAFLFGIDGLWNEIQVIVNNPISITTSSGTITDNEFIWPTATIGPSPVNGKRRIYVACRNSVTHAAIPVENVYIAYADFSGDDIESGIPFVWSYTSIPVLNEWNIDIERRRPNYCIACDNAGNLYYLGYHTANNADNTVINEPDIDVFKCPSYGAGTWTRMSWNSTLPTWNPPSAPGLAGYFVDDESNIPYTDQEIFWKIANSNHSNAGVDDLGRIHVPGLWALTNESGAYYPNLQFVKELVFNTHTGSMTINEVYPRRDSLDAFNQVFTPWDMEAPWGAVDEYIEDGAGGYYPGMATDWNFPYWDSESHDGAMMFHCANMKITDGNGQGMLAMVWQNSLRAKLYNGYNDGAYQDYANVPEICISVSSNNGDSWSEPIYLNSIDNPQLAGMKPMWVYPADKVKYLGINQNGQKVGKLGLMFYDDYTWGSNVIAPSEFPNDGGRVMFTELQIEFPLNDYPASDPFGEPVQLTGSMQLNAGVMINNVMAQSSDVVAAFVTSEGNTQLRGKGTVVMNQLEATCQMQIFTQIHGELITFQHWNHATGIVTDLNETLLSEVGGTAGVWPDSLFWLHEYELGGQSLSMQQGWNMVSLNVTPETNSINSIFSPIMNNVQAIKSPEGVYIPSNPFNTLAALTEGKGYFVMLSTQSELEISGEPVNTNNPIALARGWNLVGFTPQVSLPVHEALASLGNALIQVKGSQGVYEPGNPYNTLFTMIPGNAYWVKTNASATIVYPSSGTAVTQNLRPGTKLWGSPVIKTNSQTILARPDGANHGDLLAAFVGDELRGLATIVSYDGIAAAMLQVFTDEPAEQIVFKLYNSGTGEISMLSPALSSIPGESIGSYSQAEFYNLKSEQPSSPELVTTLLSAAPNPFKDGTSIAFQVGKNAEPIKIEVFNLRGQRIYILHNGSMEAGYHKLQWKGVDEKGRAVASGIYFCRLTGATTTQNMKLMVLK